MPRPATHPVIVLAAGVSRRMGSPKPLLDFDGRTCLDLAIRTCADAGCAPVIVVLGAEAEKVRAGCRLLSSTMVVVNEDHVRGQTSSVKAGIRALPPGSSAFFVHPADHPLVTAGVFGALAAAFARRPAGRSIVIPVHAERRGHPVLFAADHREAILALDEQTPLHDLIRARGDEIEHVPADNPGVIMGMNTEEEYRALLAEFRARRGAGGRP